MIALALLVMTWLFLLSGAFFVVVGAIGIFRFPDFYSRLHAAGVTDTFGADLMLVGLVFKAFAMAPSTEAAALVSVKLVLIVAFIFFTSPTATHAIAHAAHVAGLKPFLHPLAAREESAAAERSETS